MKRTIPVKLPKIPEKITLIGDKLLIWRHKPERSEGGIIMPGNLSDASLQPLFRHYIVDKGRGPECDKFEIGQEVLLAPSAGHQVYPEPIQYYIIDAASVIGTREPIGLEN